jgi:hypothetical protein
MCSCMKVATSLRVREEENRGVGGFGGAEGRVEPGGLRPSDLDRAVCGGAICHRLCSMICFPV